ncbi:MAG: exodeoxyribonuclease VII large subunit, partial [Ignavibacteria bacterium 13_1_40CM_2_61_4]
MSQRGRVYPLPMPGRPDRVFTVSELTQSIKGTLEERYGIVVVQGEVTAIKRPSSGHTYFSLKDSNAEIAVVLFARQTTAAIREVLQDGLAVQVEGEITVYPKRGQYQILASRVEPVGYGALQAQFEALKRKLQAEGLFAFERKRPLPRYPTRIGIVTSASGAALHDIVRILRARAPYVSITLADTRVQGEGAAREIAQALARMNTWGRVDVIVVGRGGGSPQDLWAF